MSPPPSLPDNASREVIRQRLAALPEPARLLEALFTHLPVGLQLYDATGHCVIVNEEFLALFGAAPPPEYNVLRDEIAASTGVLELIHRAFAGETVQTPPVWYDPRELRQVDVPQGRRVAIQATFTPLLDEGGRVRHVALIFKDVTAETEARAVAEALREGAERERDRLRESEGQMRLILDGVKDHAISLLDAEGRILTWNAAAARIKGYSLEEVRGQRIDIYFTDEDRADGLPTRELAIARELGRFEGRGPRRRKDGSLFFAEISLSALRDDDGNLRGFVKVTHDITASHHAERALQLLAAAGALDSESFDVAGRLQSLATVAVPALGDVCFADLLEDDGALSRVGVAHVDPASAALAERLRCRWSMRPGEALGIHAVLHEPGTQVLAPLTDAGLVAAAHDDEQLATLRALGIRAAMIVPLVARGRVLGALTFLLTRPGRAHGAEDISVAEEFARRAALAVDNARLFEEAQRAERRARTEEERLRLLVATSEALEQSLDLETTVAKVARLLVPALGDLAGVYLLEPSGRIRQIAAAHVDPAQEPLLWELAQLLPLSLEQPRALPTAIRTGASQLHAEIPAAVRAPWLRTSRAEEIVASLGMRSYMAVPLKVRDRAVGALAISTAGSARTLGPSELAGAEEVARRVAVAIDNAQLFNAAQLAKRRATFLAEVSAALASSLDYEATLTNVGRLVVPALADFCTVDVIEEGRIRRVVGTAVDPDKEAALRKLQERYPPELGGPQPASEVLRTGKTLLLLDLQDRDLPARTRDAEHLAIMRTLAPRSAIVVPMRAYGSVVGAITFARSAPGPRYEAAEITLAEEVAGRAALAIDNARLYEQAQSANRLKDEFLATVSHELRTPLNAILGWARLLRGGTLDDAKRARAIETIERNAVAQAQLIEDLLDISRIITGKLRLAVTLANPALIVDQAIESVRPAAEAKEIWLQKRIEPAVGKIAGDPDRLQQIVWNLLSNAVKFTPRGGRVSIGVARSQGQIEMVVEDTGQGIPPSFLPHVFERFRQADGGIQRKHGGLGLGLAIVRHLVELHGGTIEAASEGEGRGATFVVRLPIAQTRPTPPVGVPAVLPEAPEVPAGLAGLRVLIVDDEPDARELLGSLFEHARAEVALAGSASDALDALTTAPPDVLISDIGMPVQDGYSFIRAVRALPPERGGRVPAVALTAYARRDDRARALEAGFDEHVAKPVEPAALLLLVASLAGQPTRSR